MIDGTWTWRQLTGTQPFTQFAYHEMVWDGSRVLMFGGRVFDGVSYIDSDETWQLVGDTWSQLAPSTTPDPREQPRMVWDGSRVLMAGGIDGDTSARFEETWEYTASNWHLLTTADFWPDFSGIDPPDNFHVSPMIWDGTRALILVPVNADGAETWQFASGNWSRVTLVHEFGDNSILSQPRRNAALCWAGDRAVGGGGLRPTGASFNDTCELQSDWTVTLPYVSVPGPTQWLHRSRMRFVWTGAEVYMFGGGTSTVGTIGDPTDNQQWTYQPGGSVWSQITPGGTTPGARESYAMCWDGTRIILSGGVVAEGSAYYGDTWVLEPIPPVESVAISHRFGLQ